MTGGNGTRLTETEFTERFAAEFKISPVPSGQSLLCEELGLDSVDMVDLILFLEDLAGLSVVIEPEVYPVIRSVHDAFLYYEDAASGDG